MPIGDMHGMSIALYLNFHQEFVNHVYAIQIMTIVSMKMLWNLTQESIELLNHG